jgi:hypothetical protein
MVAAEEDNTIEVPRDIWVHLKKGRVTPSDLVEAIKKAEEGKQEEEPVCKRCNAYKGLVKALEEQLSNHREKADKYREDVCTLESEREANSVLTEELNKVLNPLSQEPVAWRLHVEQRLLTWKQRFINESGDQLSLCDFMDKRSIDDLLDYVLDQYALPNPSPPSRAEEAVE